MYGIISFAKEVVDIFDGLDIIIFIITAFVFFFMGYVIRRIIAEKKIISAEIKAKEIELSALENSEKLKKETLISVNDEIHTLRTNLDKETRERRNELLKSERRNSKKEEALDSRQRDIDKRDKEINSLSKKLKNKELKLESLEVEKTIQLQEVANLSRDEAKEILLEEVDKLLDREKAIKIRKKHEEIEEEALKHSQKILANTLQSIASEYVAENTVSVVELPNEEMKGRIIGREGRNIRAFEKETGVDVIIDDTPEAVILSCFDCVRRETAKMALEKLISDGRIHPARIEEAVVKAEKEIDEKIKVEGRNAIFELEINRVHPELIKLLGRLQFRTSYGQNQLLHSIEVAKTAAVIAKQLGVNVRLAKRAALFHDIGKAVDQFMEGTHVELGMDLLKKYGEKNDVIHSMSTHHGDYEPQTIEAIVVTIADIVSASRPGARRESLDAYIKRLHRLEEIATSYDGVESAYAIQAGREIRVMVSPEKISDDQMVILSKNISDKIEDELEYPGKVKVHLIREFRSVSYAK